MGGRTDRPRLPSLVDHDVGGLDNGVDLVALSQLQLVRRLGGDDRGDGPAADIDPDLGRDGAAVDGGDPAAKPVAGAEGHGRLLRSFVGRGVRPYLRVMKGPVMQEGFITEAGLRWPPCL